MLQIKRRTYIKFAAGLAVPALGLRPARAHHGWSGFDTARPLYLEGRIASVSWGNPHAELEVEPKASLAVPADLAKRAIPPQTASVDVPGILAKAEAPKRNVPRWTIELAPLFRMEAWQVRAPKVGDPIALVGYASPGEQGPPVIRVEFLFLDGKAYGLRSSPA